MNKETLTAKQQSDTEDTSLIVTLDMFGSGYNANKRLLQLAPKAYGPQSRWLRDISHEDTGEASHDDPIMDPAYDTKLSLIDEHFLEYMQGILSLPLGTDMAQIYAKAQEEANATLAHFVKTVFPAYYNIFSINNDTSNPTTKPHISFNLGFTPSAEKAFSAKRQLLLTYVAMCLEARERNYHLGDEAYYINKILDRQLYTPQDGKINTVRTRYALHDNITNEVVAFISEEEAACFKTADHAVHVKKHEKKMRYIEGIGHVYSDAPRKERTSAILKALRKAQKDLARGGDGILDPNSVQDEYRMMFAIEGTTDIDDPKIDTVIEKVKALLEKNAADPKSRIRTIESITREDQTNGDDDQSPYINFKRLLVKFQGVPVPVEIMFTDEKGHINSEFWTGEKDPHTNIYDGPAHKMYEVVRLMRLLEYLYPENIINHNGINIRQAALNQLDNVTRTLKSENRLVPTAENNHQIEEVVFTSRQRVKYPSPLVVM